ncbi:MAG TPA: tetratricopeptide repeat protein [Terriglobales bacterium]|nr:tetratricopeptide repeat protein [Terriglobales bacterium]
MKESQLCKVQRSGTCFGIRVLVLLLTLAASALSQAGSSRATEIHNHLQKAAEYLKANNPGAAAVEFNAVLALDPKNADAYANLGVIAFLRRDYRKASAHLRKALAIDPSLVKTQALRGICQNRLGDPSARANLEKSFSKLKDKPLRLQVGMELAGLDEQQGDSGATASVMQSLVDLDPDNVDVLFMAQRVYSELADDTLNKLAILAPGSARMQQVIAEYSVNNANLKRAIEHYRKALEIDPHLPGVHFELAEAILESSPNDLAAQAEAEKELTTAIATEGDNAKVQCELGRIAFLRSNLSGAHEHYTRAFTMDPNNPGAQLGLGDVLMSMEKPQEARKYLEMAIQSDPLNGQARYRLAMAYRRLQMPEDAEKQMHLFQEIKKTKDQVKVLYRQMDKETKPQDDELLGSDQ